MEKRKSRVLSMILALVMMVGVFAPSMARAAEVGDTPKTTNVHIRKLELEEKKGPVNHNLSKLTNGEISTKLELGGENNVKGLNGVIFSYVKLDSEDDYKKVYDAKPDDLGALNKVKDLSRTDYKETPLEATDDENGEAGWITAENLADGYYWFFEKSRPSSVTDAIAVPFGITLPYQNLEGVNADGTKDDLTKAGTVRMTDIYIYPKNVTEKNQIDKGFGKVENKDALDSKKLNEWKDTYGPDYNKYKEDKAKIDARIGSIVDFETKTKLKKGKIFKNISWSDTMTDGLEYVDGSLKITVTKVGSDGINFDQVNDVTITPQGTYGFDVEDKGEFVKNKLNVWLKEGDVEFTFKYQAKVTKVDVIDQPESNNISFTPNKTNHNNETTGPDSSGNIKVEKTWADKTVPDSVLVTYNLIDRTDNKVVASVTLKNKQLGDPGIQSKSLNKGITVGNNGDYKVTFSGLNKTHQYSVEEFADGYAPEYTSGNTITNNLSPDSIHPTPPQVVTGGKKFVKTDKEGNKRLLGAKFYITNEDGSKYLAIDKTAANDAVEAYNTAEKEYNDAIDAYNKLSAEEQNGEKGTEAKKEIASKKTTRDEKFVDARAGYVWKSKGEVATEEEIKAGNTSNKPVAVVLASDDQGRFEITGLAYGTYKLVEFVAPAEYALNTEPVEFTVDENSYTTDKVDIKYNDTDQSESAKKVPNNKVTIPQTGGIGTAIFIVAGIALMGGAFIAMRKNTAEEV